MGVEPSLSTQDLFVPHWSYAVASSNGPPTPDIVHLFYYFVKSIVVRSHLVSAEKKQPHHLKRSTQPGTEQQDHWDHSRDDLAHRPMSEGAGHGSNALACFHCMAGVRLACILMRLVRTP
jgi:hypothetical protein